MTNFLISIIIPTYNESGNIKKLLREISKILHGYCYEILVVDDMSLDGTGRIVSTMSKTDPRIQLILHTPPKGLGSSILTGIRKAKGDIIIGMDADLNHDPQVIPQLLSKLKYNDICVASRFIGNGGMDEKIRNFFSHIFNNLLKRLLAFPITDNTSGFYAIRNHSLKKLPLPQIYRGYGEYHLRLVYYAKKRKLKISEVPVYYKKREAGESKSQLLKMFAEYFIVALKLKFQR